MLTYHRYLKKYPVDPKAKKLILGTIHPHNHENFKMDFFYGNELSIWKILHRAFPETLHDPSNIDSVLSFLQTKGLTISDTLESCERMNPTALDKDLIPKTLHKENLIRQIKESDIEEILCTSGFGKNNAFKLFYCDILGYKLSKKIRDEKFIILPELDFGRPIKVRFIYSPSRRALAGIAKSKAYKAVRHIMTIEEFRIEIYKKAID